MRFAVAVLACALAVANAQFKNFGFGNGQYQPGQYQRYQNGAYNNPFQAFNRQPQKVYKPFENSTPFKAPARAFASASVSSAPAFVTAAPAVVVSAAPAVVPVVPKAVVPVAPFAPVAKVASSDRTAETVRQAYDINPDGSYNYFYETNNGIAAQAQGTPRDFGGNPPVVPDVAQGSFSWISPEGKTISVTYVADENGYQPQSDSLPQPPEVPAQIARALDYIARNARN